MPPASHSLVVTLCVLIGFGATRIPESAVATDSKQPQLTILLTGTDIVLRGEVSSVAHEAILRQRVLKLFPNKMKTFDLREQPALPPGWALVTEATLLAIAETYSSTTEIDPSGILIEGLTRSGTKWREGTTRIERNLLPGMSLRHRVAEIALTGSLNRQCTALFHTTFRGRKIEFPRAGATLNTSASPLLDELIQITADCPDARIAITGHTDNTGNEADNRTLSKARADAVAAYMTAGGISAGRISASGAGSSSPLVAGTSAQASQVNRRIDIEIDFPER